jgi:hypothetical protein
MIRHLASVLALVVLSAGAVARADSSPAPVHVILIGGATDGELQTQIVSAFAATSTNVSVESAPAFSTAEVTRRPTSEVRVWVVVEAEHPRAILYFAAGVDRYLIRQLALADALDAAAREQIAQAIVSSSEALASGMVAWGRDEFTREARRLAPARAALRPSSAPTPTRTSAPTATSPGHASGKRSAATPTTLVLGAAIAGWATRLTRELGLDYGPAAGVFAQLGTDTTLTARADVGWFAPDTVTQLGIHSRVQGYWMRVNVGIGGTISAFRWEATAGAQWHRLSITSVNRSDADHTVVSLSTSVVHQRVVPTLSARLAWVTSVAKPFLQASVWSAFSEHRYRILEDGVGRDQLRFEPASVMLTVGSEWELVQLP